MRLPRFFLFLLVLGLCFVWTLPERTHAGDDWMPLDPADLAMKTSSVEKDADAEAIFWLVRVADEVERGNDPRTVLRHYMRIKIFTDRGRESQSKIDIPYLSGQEIKDIAARTIKSDGSIIELNKSDIFDRTIVKANGVKLKAKSFAMPGIEAGAVVEYRWREIRNNSLTFYDRFSLQRDIPVRVVKYYLKPANLPSYVKIGMNAKTFHGDTTPWVKEKDGYYSTTMVNVQAFREEPRMPPEDELRAWMLVYYTDRGPVEPAQLYAKLGKDTYEEYKSVLKANDDVKKAAAEAIGDATTPPEKLRRLFDFCRTRIRNIYDDAEGLTADERAKMKDNKNAADVLKRGYGGSRDIDVLFAALANAAGFESRITLVSDRSQAFFDSNSTDDFQLSTFNVAVKVGDEWRFFDPASKYVSFGMLRWQEENQQALIPDPKNPVFATTPLSPPEKSKQKRRANLRLNEDGTLEGDVSMEYTGHFAAEMKEDYDEESPTQREESLKETVKERMSTAELTAIKIDNVTDPDKPLVFSYHIKVPGYAQRTGKRLFLQPAFFVHGAPPIFNTTSRKYSIYFSYPWSEDDEVTIELPAGFVLDNADAPNPIRSGVISEYKPFMAVTNDGKRFIAKRSFFFGGGGVLLFPVSSYPLVKAFFDNLNTSDNHTITLKQGSTAATPQ